MRVGEVKEEAGASVGSEIEFESVGLDQSQNGGGELLAKIFFNRAQSFGGVEPVP